MTHENKPESVVDNDLVAIDEQDEPTLFKSKEQMVKPRIVLQIPLPELKETANPADPTEDLGERMNEWTREFKRAAEYYLKGQGYGNVKVEDFESLQYTDGYDENDYLLKVRLGTGGDGKVGEEGISSVPLICRRVPGKRLQGE